MSNRSAERSAPVVATERLTTLDAVRGAAVLGILLANIYPLSGHTFLAPDAYKRLPLAGLHEPLLFLMFVLVEAKFYSLFSFLFGVGFAVFIGRAAARGADAARLYKRRLAGLLVIGLAHTILVWMGDILATYALIGFALVPFVRASDRAVLRWAAGMLLLPILLYGAVLAGTAAIAPEAVAYSAEPHGELPPLLRRAAGSFATGGYADVVEGNVVFTAANAARRLMLMFFPRVFGMFLLGFYVGRRNIFAQLRSHEPLLWRVVVWGTLAGVPLSIVGAALEGNSMGTPNVLGFVETVVKSVGAPALALAYAAGFALLFDRVRPVARAFGAVGQMALTNYLLHSVAGVAIFYGVGLGLFGAVPLAVVMAGALAFFLLQAIASRWWLARAAYGPVEWLWRMFTYGRWVPLAARGAADAPAR